jgi:hypothetical protein
MMRVKVEKVGDGQHPSEVIVGVRTRTGLERLVVNTRSIVNDTLDVGYPITTEKDSYLVELPRETQTGSWRVWVSGDLLVEA